jgi:hypothetical protein
MIRSPDPDDEEDPRTPNPGLLSSRALLLMVIAVCIALMCVHSPRWGSAIAAGVTALVLLSQIVR